MHKHDKNNNTCKRNNKHNSKDKQAKEEQQIIIKQKHIKDTPRSLTSIAGPVMTLCKSRAHNDVVWDAGPGSYTTSHLDVFAGPGQRADSTEVSLKALSTFRETVPKARHLPTEVRGGRYHRAGM